MHGSAGGPSLEKKGLRFVGKVLRAEGHERPSGSGCGASISIKTGSGIGPSGATQEQIGRHHDWQTKERTCSRSDMYYREQDHPFPKGPPPNLSQLTSRELDHTLPDRPRLFPQEE